MKRESKYKGSLDTNLSSTEYVLEQKINLRRQSPISTRTGIKWKETKGNQTMHVPTRTPSAQPQKAIRLNKLKDHRLVDL